jgi:predicted dehydrogenase
MNLLLGHGYWGKNIAKTLGSDLYAICDDNIKVLENVKELYPNLKQFNSLDDALNDTNITKVFVATKANTHYELAKKIILSGRHVWLEKPACVTIKEIDELIDLSERKNVKVFVDHIMCHDSKIKYLKENLNIGNPLFFESYRLHQGMFQPDVDVTYDLAVHDLSIIDYLFPNIQLISKEIIKNNHINNLADHAILNFKFNNGLRVTIICSWISPIKHRQIFIGGSEGFIHINDEGINLTKLKKTIDDTYSQDSYQSKEFLEIIHEPGLLKAIESFQRMIDGNENEITNLHQAKRIQQWLA